MTQLVGAVPVTVSITIAPLADGVLASSYSPSAYLYNYFGTDGNAGEGDDFPTVRLHEMAHGLGFFDPLDSATGSYGYGAVLSAESDTSITDS
jgi:hypothetical protein